MYSISISQLSRSVRRLKTVLQEFLPEQTENLRDNTQALKEDFHGFYPTVCHRLIHFKKSLILMSKKSILLLSQNIFSEMFSVKLV